MKCPYCGNPDTKVIDSRPAEDGSSIRRRRACVYVGSVLQLIKDRDNPSYNYKKR